MKQSDWYVYLVRCADNTLYCGITNDLEARLQAHNSGKGAKYIVPSRRPVALAYSETFPTKSDALSREFAIKKLTKKQKEAIISDQP